MEQIFTDGNARNLIIWMYTILLNYITVLALHEISNLAIDVINMATNRSIESKNVCCSHFLDNQKVPQHTHPVHNVEHHTFICSDRDFPTTDAMHPSLCMHKAATQQHKTIEVIPTYQYQYCNIAAISITTLATRRT